MRNSLIVYKLHGFEGTEKQFKNKKKNKFALPPARELHKLFKLFKIEDAFLQNKNEKEIKNESAFTLSNLKNACFNVTWHICNKDKCSDACFLRF